MKNFKYILSSIILTLLLAACDVQEASQDTEPVISTDGYPTASFTFLGGELITNEKDETVYAYDIVLDKPIKYSVDFNFVVLGGTATEGEDYDFVTGSIDAYETTGQLMVIIYNDDEKEETETLEIAIIPGPAVADAYLLNPNTQYPPPLNLTIHNYVSDAIDMSFDWEKDINYAGDTFSACGNIDLDIFVSDAAGFDINDPWATFNGTNYAATGDCPEEFDMNMSDWGDGEYIIWHENWSNGFAGLGTNTLVPITTIIIRAGSFEQVVVQDASQALNSDNGGEDDDVPFMTHGFLFKVTIANGLFTISDYNGNDVITGKTANLKKAKRPVELRK